MNRWYLDTSAAIKLMVGEAGSAELIATAAISLAADVLVCYDARLSEAARSVGLAVSSPG